MSLHQRSRPDVADEDQDAQHALEHRAQEEALRNGGQRRLQPRVQLHRQPEEQTHRQRDRQRRRDGHQQLVDDGRVVPLRVFALALFLLGVHAADFRRAHQVLVARGHGIDHVEHAADDGQLEELRAVHAARGMLFQNDSPSGLRTAIAVVFGPRIMMPSRRAWPPMLVFFADIARILSIVRRNVFLPVGNAASRTSLYYTIAGIGTFERATIL